LLKEGAKMLYLFRQIDECAEPNKKLDSKLKKKEEALKKTARDFDEVENR
jgi:hypothetical protein